MSKNKLKAALEAHVLNGVRESFWYNTAPPDIQTTLKINTIGLETHVRSSLYEGDSDALPVLVAEVECGEETRRFAFSLGSARDMG